MLGKTSYIMFWRMKIKEFSLQGAKTKFTHFIGLKTVISNFNSVKNT